MSLHPHNNLTLHDIYFISPLSIVPGCKTIDNSVRQFVSKLVTGYVNDYA
uniref:Uncharacterized protein n=1 Tax=Rhizophora mucronata TaxID=61149 RepID=A0A2P2LIE8_RHIMU